MTIKEIRNLTNLTQEEFCKKYNIPLQTYKKWELNTNSPHYRECAPYFKDLLERLVKIDFNISNEQ